ncbi:RUN domain-containing protein 3B-like isoform X2 [Gordionus sp. m RMFG-2023]|uniref:RUN domain-containing protein 3B-like isoform X2 n=1 Tax=Gordionus sp. m RMFG-2023 TaxID=3053472 RepID=UPI0031FDF67C
MTMEILNTITSASCFSPTALTSVDIVLFDNIKHGLEQAKIKRQSLFSILNLAVMEFADKYQNLLIEDNNSELKNIFAILENILKHRLKRRKCWFGSEGDTISFWDYIKVICKNIYNGSCVQLVETMSYKTSKAKGRAWLRLAVIEKRLHLYLMEILKYKEILKPYYLKGAFMLCQESKLFPEVLLELNKIDITMCVKDMKLDLVDYDTIDYTNFLRPIYNKKNQRVHINSSESKDNSNILRSGNAITVLMMTPSKENNKISDSIEGGDEEEMEEEESGIGIDDVQNFSAFAMESAKSDNPWKYLFYRMEDMYKTVASQKKKLEKLLETRDEDMATLIRRNDILSAALKNYGFCNTIEKERIDGVILGLENLLIDISDRKKEMNECLPNRMKALKYKIVNNKTDDVVAKIPESYLSNKDLKNEIIFGGLRGNVNIRSLDDLVASGTTSCNYNATRSKLSKDTDLKTRLALFGFTENSFVKSHTYSQDKSVSGTNSFENLDTNGTFNKPRIPSSLTNEEVLGKLSKSISCNMMADFIDQKLIDINDIYN